MIAILLPIFQKYWSQILGSAAIGILLMTLYTHIVNTAKSDCELHHSQEVAVQEKINLIKENAHADEINQISSDYHDDIDAISLQTTTDIAASLPTTTTNNKGIDTSEPSCRERIFTIISQDTTKIKQCQALLHADYEIIQGDRK